MKNTLLLIFFVCSLRPAVLIAQTSPKIKIDGVAASADPVSGIKLPYWLNANQTLAADQDVNALSVMEFTVNGTELEFSQILNVTTVQTVPAGKVWKIESIAFPSSASTPTNWGITGNGGTTAGTNFVGTTGTQDLVLKTNNLEGIRLQVGGNVGIGTASPSAKLEIAGQIKVTGGSPALNKVLISSDATGLAAWSTAAGVGLVSGSGTLNFVPKFTPDGVTLGNSTIFDNGNVGIGTTSPASKLTVAGLIHSTTGGVKFPDNTVQTTANKLVNVTYNKDIVRRGISDVSSGVSLHSFTVDKKSSTSILVLNGVMNCFQGYSGGSAYAVKYGSGTEEIMNTTTYIPSYATGMPIMGYITGHTTTGPQTLNIRVTGGLRPCNILNPTTGDYGGYSNQTASFYIVQEIEP